jgi:hypothetical protein
LALHASRHLIVNERRISSSVPPIQASAAWAGSINAAVTDKVLGLQIMRMFSSSSSSSKGEKDEGEILKPRQTRLIWSAEADEKLKNLYESGLPWVEIADHFEGRTKDSCKGRYYYLYEGEKRINLPWSDEDSLRLKELKEKSNMSWVRIAAHFEGRTIAACLQRYGNVLFEGEKQIPWSDEELLKLKELKEKNNMSWVQIGTHFKDRNVASCKTRYCSFLFEGEKRIYLPWSDVDSLKLNELKEKSGASWAQIAAHFDGRTMIACRSRYFTHSFDGEEQ